MASIPKSGKVQHRAGVGGMFLAPAGSTVEIHYGRTSTDDQAEAGTIQNQQHALGLQARDRGVRIAGAFWDEGVSGTVMLADRPEGRKLLECARAHAGAVVVIYRLDRLGRSLRALLDAYDALDATGVTIRSATEPFDTATRSAASSSRSSARSPSSSAAASSSGPRPVATGASATAAGRAASYRSATTSTTTGT
jgi:hypothetical protein